MVAQGDAIGVLHLRSDAHTQGLKPRDPVSLRQAIQSLAEHLSLALANFRLRETLLQQSIRDPLTGLFNRRFQEETLERELRRAARTGQPLAVVAIDVDHFKRFNDVHGHDAGDELLRVFGDFLRSHVRAEDVPCRSGGEEFTLLLPQTSIEAAVERAEAFRVGAKGLSVSLRDAPRAGISISLGVAIYPTHAETSASLLRAADQALYRAKAAGRDRVVVASLEGEA